MKIWVDDVRPAPDGYVWYKTVEETIAAIKMYARWRQDIEVIDLDHDAGEFYKNGGDYIEILNYLEEYMLDIPIRIHSMNPVGVANMRAIIERNVWREVR